MPVGGIVTHVRVREVLFLEMHPRDGQYEPLVGYIVLGAVTDEQRRSRPGAAPPRRAGAISLSGFVSPQSQSPGYAPSSCLARKRNRLQQNRNLFLHRPLEQCQAAVDMLGHRLVHVKKADLK